jgi:chitin biosynthesis protein CHS5
MLSTKISGLALDTEYSFYLVLRTTGGTYHSNTLTVRTQKMTDLTGITVTPGVLPGPLRDALETAIERIGAKIADTVRIDTTHFVCTEGRGKDWERAVEMNIPVVRPEWVEGCEREGKIVGVRGYYLDANPKHRQVGANPALTGQSASSSSPSQSNLPVRTPKSPSAESAGEPGPEVPPTPPPKKEAPPVPPKNEDTPEIKKAETEKLDEKRPVSPDENSEEEEEQEISRKNSETAPNSDERGGDMEDVAL